jgi:hypothetical protein
MVGLGDAGRALDAPTPDGQRLSGSAGRDDGRALSARYFHICAASAPGRDRAKGKQEDDVSESQCVLLLASSSDLNAASPRT